MNGKTFSRRTFLKGSLATGLVLGAGSAPSVFTRAANAADAPSGKPDGWYNGFCRMCMWGSCFNQYRVENGVVAEVRGTKGAPHNMGTLCGRGNAIIQNMYNPYRVKAPMKRTNPKKGLNEDPRWVEISWEEAYKTVADKIGEVRKRDPRRVMLFTGFGDMEMKRTFMPYMMGTFAGCNSLETHGPLCTVHYASALVQGAFPVAVTDMSLCKYSISIGSSANGTGIASANGPAKGTIDGIKKRGMKVVHVNPKQGVDGTLGEWVPIRAGTDMAFLLGMTYTMMYELQKFDDDFLQWRTNAPYIIGKDGLYHRSAGGKPMILDKADGKLKEFDDKSLRQPDIFANVNEGKAGFLLVKESIKSYTPEWAEKISTVPAATIRRITKEFVDAAKIGSTITLNDGVEMPYRPAAIILQRGAMNHKDGSWADLVAKYLGMMVGSLDMPGGCLGIDRGPNILKPDKDGVVAPHSEATMKEHHWPQRNYTMVDIWPHKHSMTPMAMKALKSPKSYGLEYPIEAAFFVAANPITGLTRPAETAAAIAGIPFSACIAYTLDEVAQLCDILLPTHAMLEKDAVSIVRTSNQAYNENTLGLVAGTIRDPMPPVYNTVQPQDIILEIANRLGTLPGVYGQMSNGIVMQDVSSKPKMPLDNARRYKYAEIVDIAMKSFYGDEFGSDYFKKNGFKIRYDAQSACYNHSFFPKGTTRHPFYYETLLKSGRILKDFYTKNNVKLPDMDLNDHFAYYTALPVWRANDTNTINKNYPLVAFNYKTPLSVFKIGGADHLPWIREVGNNFDDDFKYIRMNPATAAKMGFKNGEEVVVESRAGKIEGRLSLSELFHPDTVGIAGDLGRKVKTMGDDLVKDLHFNELIVDNTNTLDPISGGIAMGCPVKVTKKRG